MVAGGVCKRAAKTTQANLRLLVVPAIYYICSPRQITQAGSVSVGREATAFLSGGNIAKSHSKGVIVQLHYRDGIKNSEQ